MWFVFPQIEGLGYSPTAQHYAISGLDEARAYLAHPALGPRLVECAAVVAATTGRTVEQIFGWPDDLKLRSSMTLFLQAAPDEPVFRQVLDRYFDGGKAHPRAGDVSLRFIYLLLIEDFARHAGHGGILR